MHPQQNSEGLGHDDHRVAKVGEVDHEEGQRGDGGQQELVPPSQVQHVVSKAQEDHAAYGQESTDELHKLLQETHKDSSFRWVYLLCLLYTVYKHWLCGEKV